MWSFSVARARRILPALVVLVAVLLLVGWWVLAPIDYRQLAIHAGFALAFLSNLRFWQEAGYFDAASHDKWLLHTWSLSVELQFYLLLPLAFFALWWLRPCKGWLAGVVAVVLVGSLWWAVVHTPADSSGAFYLLPTRAWELLAGALVYLVADRVRVGPAMGRSLEWAGLLLIGLALIAFDSDTPWPGSAAIVPVLGTALVLLAARQTPGWAKPVPLQWLGRVSYSLYLWHWPVVVALVYLGWQGSPGAIAAGVLVALVLAGLSYYLVEQPSRRWLTQAGLVRAPLVLGLVVVVAGAFAISVYADRGVPGRLGASAEAIATEANNTSPYRDNCHGRIGDPGFPWCHFGGEDIRVVLVGDSHASMLLTAVKAALPPNAGMYAASFTSCQTLFGARKTDSRLPCQAFNAHVLTKLDSLPPSVPVLVSNRLSAAALGDHRVQAPEHGRPSVYFGEAPVDEADDAFRERFRQEIVASACKLAARRPVYWLRPIPEMPVDVPRWMARQTILHGAAPQVLLQRPEYEQRHRLVNEAMDRAAEQCGVHVLDPAPFLCDEQVCFGSRDGLPLYYDVHHLSERGNRQLVPLFRQTLN